MKHIFEGKSGKIEVEQKGNEFSFMSSNLNCKITVTPFYSQSSWGLGIYPKVGISDSLQSQIKAEIAKQFNSFVESLRLANSLKAKSIGYDVVEYIITPTVDTKENRFFLSIILRETGGQSFMAKTALNNGEDVTPMVLARWQKSVGSTPIAPAPVTFECYECGHTYLESDAKKCVASGEGAWEGHTGFYCGC